MEELQVKVRDERFKDINDHLEEMRSRQEEFCQSRSEFQIEKFIACDEHTPASRFRMISHNSYVALQEARRLMIERERKQRKIDKLTMVIETAGKGDRTYDNCDLDIYELQRQLQDDDIRIKGLLREVQCMEAICAQLEKDNGKKFTYEQFRAEEPEYWRIRLASQMHRDRIGGMMGIGAGNYSSYLQAVEKPILPDSCNKITPFNFSDNNAIATVALDTKQGVSELLLEKRGKGSADVIREMVENYNR